MGGGTFLPNGPSASTRSTARCRSSRGRCGKMDDRRGFTLLEVLVSLA
ncbi:MAG: hypothetical protein CO109_13525, partial [Deltaproteobacteria bacterium CG_4_9_14_3_um_filter_65_9]